jgi:hypothetical protein
MEFKIDTKPSYTILSPADTHLDANLTEGIRQKWEELTKSGSQNLIIDLENFSTCGKGIGEWMVSFHEEMYAANQSLVFANPQVAIVKELKEKELDLLINLSPTMIEAIDIVSMEILERDLFAEES